MYSCTILPVPDPEGHGGTCPPRRRRGHDCPKKKIAHYMRLRVYTVMVWGVSMDRTTVILTGK